MLIWKGKGFIVPLITILLCFLPESFINVIFFEESRWPKMLSFLLAGLLCFLIGKRLDQNKMSSIFIDEKTKEEIILETKHTFFFIDIKLWGMCILPLYGILSLFL